MLATAALTVAAVLPGPAMAQTAKDLAGTWTNVANVNIRQDGSRVDVFGPKGTGLAIFDSNGRFAIVNINPETPKFASNNRAQGTPEENKAAVLGGIALYGTTRSPTRSSTSRLKAAPTRTGPAPNRSGMSAPTRRTSSPGVCRRRSAVLPRSRGSGSSRQRNQTDLAAGAGGYPRPDVARGVFHSASFLHLASGDTPTGSIRIRREK
jgi:hypothetical protein